MTEESKTPEAKLAALDATKPERPPVPRVIYEDTTPEALAWGLANDWPSAGLLSNEAGSVFGGHGMQRESMMRMLALLNTLWGGASHTVARRTSESFTVSGARLSVSLMAQLPTLRAFVERGGGLVRGTGFVARFLVAWPVSTVGTRMHRDAPEQWPGLDAYHARIVALLGTRFALDGGALRPVELSLSRGAFALWRQLHDDVEHDMADGGRFASVRDSGAKTAENAARLAAVFHIVERGTEGEISTEHMGAAARIAVWHLNEAARLLAELDASPELSAAERLDEWLIIECRRRGATSIPTREVLNKGPLVTRPRVAMMAALDQLTQAGRVRLLRDGKRKLIEVNPALLAGDA